MRKGTCKHFNGTVGGQNPTCDAGVNYREVTGGPDAGWLARLPCRKRMAVRGGQVRATCALYDEPTEAEIAEDLAWLQAVTDRMKKVGPAVKQIKREHRGRDASGTVECPVCGKALAFRHHGYNGHVWMRCESDDCINFME